jgi:2-polyprenyl-3-methyl-5-hydroxy-6-metoxy-1,4-benzoquinol methylase
MQKPPPKKPQASAVPTAKHTAKPTHWAEVADWYDDLVGDEGSEYHREVILPGILRLLEPTQKSPHSSTPKSKIQNPKLKINSPLHILDLACGQGVLCRKLAALGHQLIGIDAAAPLIAAANQRNQADQLPIRYLLGDATRLRSAEGILIDGLPPESFDAITIVLAIQNIAPLSPVWQACRALLKPGGSLILVMMHPCFRIPKQSDWHWDNASSTQSRLVRQYLTSANIEIQTHPGRAAHGKDDAATTHFHRPLQAYINTLGNAGLLIDHIEEWPSHKKSQPGPRQAALDQARKEIPMFLALRARPASHPRQP